MKFRASIVGIALLAMVCVCFGEDWPQFRGENRDGKSGDVGLMKEWPKDGPTLAWRVDNLGGGDGAPAIVDGRIYVMSHRGDDEMVIALSEKDGKEIWATRLGETYKQQARQSSEGPACTPTVDGDRLYVEGMGGNVACLKIEDGTVVWQINMIDDFGGQPPRWSYRESPLVDGDKVVCTPGSDSAVMVALDKMTGKTVWKTASPANANKPEAEPEGNRRRRRGPGGPSGLGVSYASPIVIDAAGVRQYVQLAGSALIGVRAENGELLWQYDKAANERRNNCSMPVADGDFVFASSAYGNGGGLVKLSKNGDGVKADEVYFTDRLQSHHAGMILIDGYLYGATGGNEGGALMCIDFKTGSIKWDQRETAGRRAKGSMAYADGLLVYRMESGTVVLIKPDPEKYVEVSRFEQPDRMRQPAWAYPVIANGKLYIRDQGMLFCYDVKD